MEKYTCIIVDDSEIDRLTVQLYLNKFADFNILGLFSNASDAILFMDKTKVDILFLDIELPGETGIELRKKAMDISVCVFVTSYSEYAIESFELEALDYIIKPIKPERFKATIKRIEEYLDIKGKASLFESSIGGGSIFIKEGHTQTKVKLIDILYLEALKNYTTIFTHEKKHRILTNLGMLLKNKDFQSFTRVHRGYAVQKHFIQKVNPQEIIMSNNFTIPVGRNYKDNLSEII